MKINVFHQFLPHWSHILFLSNFMSSACTEKIIVVFDEEIGGGVRTNFVQEESRGLRCLIKILATCVVQDVSIYQDILILEF